MILDEKYVLHIPLCKFENEKLIPIDIEDILNDLIERFALNGYENLYVTDVKGYYKSRSYDEKLITIFASQGNKLSPEQIFVKWFKDNTTILKQEALAYEHNSMMHIEKL